MVRGRIIRPKNDPDLGMAVVRMTETDSDVAARIARSRLVLYTYNDASILLRSEDQGRTWELLPGQRHGGWYANKFNRWMKGVLTLGEW